MGGADVQQAAMFSHLSPEPRVPADPLAATLHGSSAEARCPLGRRLDLPQVWFEEEKRAQDLKLPKKVVYRSQTELALELIDQMLRWEGPRMPVVGDSAYGNSFDFREQLRQRQLSYVLAVEPSTVVWTLDPNSIPVPPSAPTGWPRRYPPLEATPAPQDLTTVARQLPASAWKKVTWRAGSRGPQPSRFTKLKVWAAHGRRTQEHPARAAEWLLIAWPEGEAEPTKYWLAQLGPGRPGLRRLVKMAHARWRIEMEYRELKDELGPDHFEGRHWLGWHHHVNLVMLAYAFPRCITRISDSGFRRQESCFLSQIHRPESQIPNPASEPQHHPGDEF